MKPDNVDSGDEFISSISEFCSYIFLRISNESCHRRKLVAYKDYSSNVIVWMARRRSGNEWASSLPRISARCGKFLEFRTYPLYIHTFNNVECGNLAILPAELIRNLDSDRNWKFPDPFGMFRFYTNDSFFRRIPFRPFDSERRLLYLYQLAEKRTCRPIQWEIWKSPRAITLRLGAGPRQNILDSTNGLEGIDAPWPSEKLPNHPPKVGRIFRTPHPHSGHITSQPHNPEGWNFVIN